MNPLSPLTYILRHKRSTLLLIEVVAAVTLGVHTTICASDSVLEYGFYMFHYLHRLTRISATGELDTAITTHIRAHPDVAHAIAENGTEIRVPGPGIPLMFPVLGVAENDLPVVMETCGLRLKEGRLVKPRAAEIMLSEEIARPLDLHVGDSISRETNDVYYAGFVTELTVVGILESIPSTTNKASRSGQAPSGTGPEVRAAFASYEYLDGHELYEPRPSRLLVIPREGRKPAVDSFLEALATEADESLHVRVETFEGNSEMITTMRSTSYGMYGFADFLLAGAATLAVAVINQVSITQRLPELGLLHALGNQRRRLIRRLVLEVAAIATAGWSVGLACSIVLSAWLNTVMYASRGEVMSPSRLIPFLFTVPIPLTTVTFAGLGISRTLKRLDGVAIIERGKLSLEDTGDKGRKANRSLPNPLSSVTFYARHRRRGLLLSTAMALMVLGVSFPAFLAATGVDGNIPWMMSHLHRASIVSPVQAHTPVDPEIVAQIRAHPASAHVIPAKPLNMMVRPAGVLLLGDIFEMSIFAVREDDMQILLDVYGVRLGDGKLPDHRHNEIVLSRALALNRGLSVGDTIGQPIYEKDDIPTKMVVTGILEPNQARSRSEHTGVFAYAPQWIGFAPYEYVAAHEQYAALPTCFLVVPSPGREAEMEDWLEEAVDSHQIAVETFGTMHQLQRQNERDLYLFAAVSQAILAIAAAGTLAVLQTIDLTQRRDEFGILHAAGYSRARLVWRALGERAGIVSVAWVMGAAVCVAAMLYAQIYVYAPIGLRLNLYNYKPWLYTLPLPVAVIAASAGTITWALNRLDPVAIIERR